MRLEFAERLLDRIEVRRIFGKKRSVAPAASITSRTPATLWTGRLSIITVSPRLSVGTRHRSRYAMKAVAFIGPSSTKGATIPRRRRPAMKVIVFQCPCGTWSINRMPRGQRPRSRTMAVLVEVSSINTSRAGSNMPCSRIQRRRARATSARSCSAARRFFFEADIVSLEQPPDRTAAAGDPSLAHRRDDLIQRQIRLLGNQRQQKVRVLLQRRYAPPGRLGRDASGFVPALHPFDRRAGARAQRREPLRHLQILLQNADLRHARNRRRNRQRHRILQQFLRRED